MTEQQPSPFSFKDDPHPDGPAQAQAALLLLESLIHTLLDQGVLTKAQVLDAIATAHEVKDESAAEFKEPPERLRRSLALLANMHTSIEAHRGPRPRGTPAIAPVDD